MNISKVLKLSAVACATVLTSGCSSIAQKNDYKKINEPISQGDLATATLNAENLAGNIEPNTGMADDLIWSLQAGTMNHITGNDQRTIMYFDAAEKSFRDENSEGALKNTGETTGAVLVNDAVIDYEPTNFDMVYANHYKAISFWKMDKASDARVEFNRAEDRQRRAAESFAEAIKEQQELSQTKDAQQVNYGKMMDDIDANMKASGIDMTGSEWTPYEGYINPAVTYASSLFFMLEGKSGNDYNKAVDGFERVYGLSKNASVKTDLEMAKSLVKGKHKDSFKPTVWIIHEDGQAPKKSEFRVDLPVFLLTGEPQVASYAIPKMDSGTPAFGSVKANDFKTGEIANISKVINSEFKEELPAIKARAAASTISKVVAQAAAAQMAKNDDTGAASIVQLGTMLYSLVSTSADIRTNVALPNSVGVVRMPKHDSFVLKAGTFDVPVNTDPNSNFSIVYIRTINSTTQPVVSVINVQ
ncbi:hypothetical protein ABXV23_10895 [Vibrio owensii]|uniref:hypothetical protein n=1 Tax=Vibrio owensii TaxID=696485 RepID=UPI003392ED65